MGQKTDAFEQLKQAITDASQEASRQNTLQRQRLLQYARKLKQFSQQLEDALLNDPATPAQQTLLALLLPDEEWGQSV